MSEERGLVDKSNIEEIVNSFPYEPLRRHVVISLNYEDVEEGIVSENSLDAEQYVIAKGSFIGDEVTLGDKYLIDLNKFPMKGGQIAIDPVYVNNNIYAFVDEQVIKAKVK